jgi:3-dehydroquinate dehydratase
MYSKKVTPKPFCPVCQAAGKTEKEYTSHFVKSEPGANGKVVCPTLLSQVCRYCDKAGHTAGYCPILAENKLREEKEKKMKTRQEAIEKREAEKVAPKVVEKKKQMNMFAALDDSSSDTDKEVKRVSKNNNKKSKVVPVVDAVTVAKAETNVEATIRMAKGLLSMPKVIYHQKPITHEEEFPALTTTKKHNDKKIITIGFEGYAAVTARAPEFSEAEMKQAMAKKAVPPVVNLSRAREEAKTYSDDEEEEYYPAEPTVTASLTDWVGKKSWAELSYESDEDW